jgi:hypothetical protein
MKLVNLVEAIYTLEKAKENLPKDKAVVPSSIAEMLIKNTKLKKYLGIKEIKKL